LTGDDTHRGLLFWSNIGLKALFVGLLAFGAFSGLDQFEGKAFGWRLVLYPIAALIVPIAWKACGSPQPYPYAADMLLVAPFLIDVAGNALDLYDSITWWDDANHFVNWALLCGALGAVLIRTQLSPIVLFGLVTGFGAAAAILWEVGEYFAFIRGGSELATALRTRSGMRLWASPARHLRESWWRSWRGGVNQHRMQKAEGAARSTSAAQPSAFATPP